MTEKQQTLDTKEKVPVWVKQAGHAWLTGAEYKVLK